VAIKLCVQTPELYINAVPSRAGLDASRSTLSRESLENNAALATMQRAAQMAEFSDTQHVFRAAALPLPAAIHGYYLCSQMCSQQREKVVQTAG
jgi:hypothetical protein